MHTESSSVEAVPPRGAGRRVVMLTDDLQIDRRIVQEALSLTRAGFRVLVLAPAPAAPAQAVDPESVPVERLQPAPYRGFSRVQRMHGSAIAALNSTSTGVQSLVERLLRAGASAVSAGGRFAGLGRPGRLGWRLAARALRLAQRALLLIIRVAAVGANRCVAWAQMPAGRRLGLSSVEWAYLQALERRGVDIVHAHDLPQLRVAAHAKRRLGVPLVYDAHECYPEIHTLTPKQQKTLRRRENRYLRDCDAVITVNPYLAREMATRYRIETPRVILNAVDPPPVEQAAAKACSLGRVLGLGPGERIALFQGWLAPGRGLEALVRAGRRLAEDIHIVLMGYGAMRADLRRIARASGATNVHFLDAVPQRELLRWSASADVGLIPYQPVDLNNRYCSPNKLFEYIQAGLPIIANDLPYLRDVVVGEGIGIVARLEQPDDFARAITSFLAGGTETYRDRIRRIAPRYSWAAQEAELFSVYRDLCG